jgi:hypothetical protein
LKIGNSLDIHTIGGGEIIYEVLKAVAMCLNGGGGVKWKTPSKIFLPPKDESILFLDAVHPTMATKVTYGWIKKRLPQDH